MAKNLKVTPTTIKKANEFVKEHHRHHRPTTNNTGRWALSAYDNSGSLVGVIIAANPISPFLMDGYTLELTRVCVSEKAPKGTCSFLISRCCKIWKEMGGRKVITYTLSTESGSSLKGAGWKEAGKVKPHKRWTNRNRVDGKSREDLTIYSLEKIRWEKTIGDGNVCKSA